MVKRPPKYVERERLGNIWMSEQMGPALTLVGNAQRQFEAIYGRERGKRAVREIVLRQHGKEFERPMGEIMGLTRR